MLCGFAHPYTQHALLAGCRRASFLRLCDFPKGAAVAAMCHRRFLGMEKAGDRRSPLQEFAKRRDSGWL